MRSLSKDEILILKQARELGDMMATPGWKVYTTLIGQQLEDRQNLMVTPLASLPNMDGCDGMTRAAALEGIKGAYMGLRLALTIPQTIVAEAERLRDSSPTEGEG